MPVALKKAISIAQWINVWVKIPSCSPPLWRLRSALAGRCPGRSGSACSRGLQPPELEPGIWCGVLREPQVEAQGPGSSCCHGGQGLGTVLQVQDAARSSACWACSLGSGNSGPQPVPCGWWQCPVPHRFLGDNQPPLPWQKREGLLGGLPGAWCRAVLSCLAAGCWPRCPPHLALAPPEAFQGGGSSQGVFWTSPLPSLGSVWE